MFVADREGQKKGKGHVSTAATLASEDDQSTARLDEVSPPKQQAWADEEEEVEDEATRLVTCFNLLHILIYDCIVCLWFIKKKHIKVCLASLVLLMVCYAKEPCPSLNVNAAIEASIFICPTCPGCNSLMHLRNLKKNSGQEF